MTITARGAGAVVAGTGGALAPAFPATIAAGDAAWINWHAKPDTVAAPTITGWTKVVDRVSGGGTAGVGTGPTRHAVYRKDGDCAGTEGGTTVSVPAVTGANMNQASIFAANKTLTSWDIAYTTGDQTTAVTAVSITESPAEAETTNDLMAMAVSGAANTNLGSQTVNATGATFGVATEHVDLGTANGNAGRLSWVSRPVTGGPATAASVYSATATAAETVGVVLLRIRETSGTSISASDTAVATDSASVGTSLTASDVGAGAEAVTLSATLAAADAAASTDVVATVGVTAADVAAGGDSASLAVAQTVTDAGVGADTATTSASLTTTDVGTGVDAASVSTSGTQVSASDSASAVDSATVAAALAATDTAASAEATGLSVSIAGSDTGSGADTTLTTASLSASDAASGVDAATASSSSSSQVSAGDTASGADAATLVASHGAADTGWAYDVASTSASLTSADTAVAVDSANVTVPLAASDTANVANNATVVGGAIAREAAVATESASVVVSVTAADFARAADTASVPSWRFSMPTHEEPFRVGKDMPSAPITYYRLTYASSLVKINGTWTVIRTPSAESLAGLKDGVDYFRGGYDYVIDQPTRDSLVMAGYTASQI